MSDEKLVKRKKRRRKKSKRWILFLLIGVFVILGIGGGVIGYIASKINAIEYVPIDRTAIAVNPDINDDTKQILEGYTNILLLGSDSRTSSADALQSSGKNHSDAILIASINNQTKEVRLVSVYRDTLLQIPTGTGENDYTYRKATESSYLYSVEATINMINKNLDLDIQDYVMIDWQALIDIVNAVGGVDADITESEMEWTNKYLIDTATTLGIEYTELTSFGKVHLDGLQATAYCRERYSGGNDFARTERQRYVIGEILANAKNMDVLQINKAIDGIVNNVATSLSKSKILELAADMMNYELTEAAGFPFECQTKQVVLPGTESMKSSVVLATSLKSNVAQLHQFLFDEDNYQSSETVREISDYIFTWTGVE